MTIQPPPPSGFKGNYIANVNPRKTKATILSAPGSCFAYTVEVKAHSQHGGTTVEQLVEFILAAMNAATPNVLCGSCEGSGRIDCQPDTDGHTHPCEDCQPDAFAEFQRGRSAGEFYTLNPRYDEAGKGKNFDKELETAIDETRENIRLGKVNGYDTVPHCKPEELQLVCNAAAISLQFIVVDAPAASDTYEAALDVVLQEVKQEILAAREIHPPFNSAHEGAGVAFEEVDEFWDIVKTKQKNRDLPKMKKEATQAAAMFVRCAVEVCDEERGRR